MYLTSLAALLIMMLSLFGGCQPPTGDAGATAEPSATAQPQVLVTVLYDNHALRTDLRGDHGFACLVEGLGQTVLFDTGASGEILLANMEALGVDPRDIDAVVLSHAHSDHTGGLSALLAVDSGVVVYYPGALPPDLVRSVQAAGAVAVPVEAATSICPGLTMTAPLGGSVAESGLVIDSETGRTPEAAPGGAVLITGCAHPGVVAMAQAAADLSGGSLYAILGGFHLANASGAQVETIIAALERLGVQRCGPAHCTGDAATALMCRAFGAGFVDMGVGAVIRF